MVLQLFFKLNKCNAKKDKAGITVFFISYAEVYI